MCNYTSKVGVSLRIPSIISTLHRRRCLIIIINNGFILILIHSFVVIHSFIVIHGFIYPTLHQYI